MATPIIMREASAIGAKIVTEFKDRSRAEIKKWRDAYRMAINPESPRTAALQDLYENLRSDGHLISEMNLRKTAAASATFSIKDKKTGLEIPEKTAIFYEEWFYNLIDDILDSVFYGFTLLELSNPQKLKFDLIQRRNTIGSKSLVLFEAYGDKGLNFSQGYEQTLLQVNKPTNIGMLADLCGLLIWKRNAQQSWAEFSEKFGMPLISATTNKTSKADIQLISDMLAALGEAANAVLPEGTTIDIKPFTGGDSYLVYDAQIQRINTEISKALVGGTMISSDGSSRSQSEVHERNLDTKIAFWDKLLITFVVNGQVLPMLKAWGYDINPETDMFAFDTAFDVSMVEHFNMVMQLSNSYEIPEEWISKTFNVPIIGKKLPEAAKVEPETAKHETSNFEPGGISANFR